jgi:hypothetical protein
MLATCHALRSRMLQACPDACTSSYEEDLRKPVSWSEARIVPRTDTANDLVLGAFTAGGMLMGAVGLTVERRMKQRHKALPYGLYVISAESPFRPNGSLLRAPCPSCDTGSRTRTGSCLSARRRALNKSDATGCRSRSCAATTSICA